MNEIKFEFSTRRVGSTLLVYHSRVRWWSITICHFVARDEQWNTKVLEQKFSLSFTHTLLILHFYVLWAVVLNTKQCSQTCPPKIKKITCHTASQTTTLASDSNTHWLQTYNTFFSTLWWFSASVSLFKARFISAIPSSAFDAMTMLNPPAGGC